MKKMITLFALLCSIISFSQKVDLVTYDQLTNPEQAKFLSKKLDFDAIQMPDGTIIGLGDKVRLGDRIGEGRRSHKKVMEDVYSTLQYGGGFASFSEAFEDGDPDYRVFYVDKGNTAIIHRFKIRRKLDETFMVLIILKGEGEYDFRGEGRARASLESFIKGELVKI